MEELHVETRNKWRRWLAKNHDRSAGIWLVFYRKHSSVPTLQYDDAVEEALCFGWIDSIIRKRNGDSHLRKFTPRKPASRWSQLNKRRVEKLIQQGLMTENGMAKVRQARASGLWDKPDRPPVSMEIPREFEAALAKNGAARRFFDRLAPSYRRQFVGWIAVAKRQETKERRIRESIALLERGEKLGMK
ncbi:MAG: YdeI/OmpD-associated family protein [Acidobacteria bacterium]|nr:YdeI/OmpD-associated family protein [Acidobacteriota bacterium]